jgi:hypothetical protein
MEEHIHKLRTLQKQLHALGDLVSDRNSCNALLTSLPGSWSTFLTAINAALPTLSSGTLIARVLEEDRTRRSTTGTDTALRHKTSAERGVTDVMMEVPQKGSVIIVAKRGIGSKTVGPRVVARRGRRPSGGCED